MSNEPKWSVEYDAEIWKQIPEFKSGHEVSNYGRVRSWIGNGGKKLDKPILRRLYEDRKGYILSSFYINGKVTNRRVHRLVLSAFDKPMSSEYDARHLNHNIKDNRLDNLKWGTRQENINDNVRDKRHLFGETHSLAKLNESQVKEIRTLISNGVSQIELSKKFCVSIGTISDIKRRVSWNHI